MFAVRQEKSEDTDVTTRQLIKGMVLLKVEDEGAWTTMLEWTDVDTLEEYDLDFLHNYILLFPLSSMATIISGFLKYFGFPGSNAEEEEKARRAKRRAETRAREGSGKKVDDKVERKRGDDEDAEEGARRQSERDRDPFALLLVGRKRVQSLVSEVGVRASLASEAHLRQVDYANAISVAEKGISLTRAIEVETGKKMPSGLLTSNSFCRGARAALDVILGTALVHYFAPKHHPRALQLLDGALKQNRKRPPALWARGRFTEAREQFEQALEMRGRSYDQEGRLEEGKQMLLEMVEVLDKDGARNQDSARVWTRLGQAEWQMGGTHREEAHEHWLNALKCFSNYAPAFTAIGIWYLEYASPSDEDRASKCFQKAFELDATEAEAARRLATALVNLIAKRVTEGEGGLEGGLSSGDKTPNNTEFLLTNAWAWKAVGAYDMINKKYVQAAQAFQMSRRADNDDPALWTRLGGVYAKSGKQVAAFKAIRKALELAPDSWICYNRIAQRARHGRVMWEVAIVMWKRNQYQSKRARIASARSNLSQKTTGPAVLKSPAVAQETAPTASALTTALERTQSHHMPVQQHSVQLVEPAMPQTQTTRRRQTLATELPEDLRMSE
ncbi:hypothetical protein QFC20_002881 [Naganishia adeliensis]|uniref:Uncharacterized protein n=1 Tax=Naganishia adeliensis TaxID=92952 RepID=A0ACC2WJ23_9TREE|nr:hypothetical protein QFC20_002881 [Naganishia adeliensis]